MRRSTVRFPVISVCLSLAFLFSCRMGSDIEAFVEEGKEKLTLTYDANGGSGSVASVTAYKAAGYTATIAGGADLSRKVFSFAGWNTAANGGGTAYAAGDTVALRNDLTLYAQWKFNLLLYAGTRHSLLAVKVGSLWCWGSNSTGQVGNGGTGDVATPTAVSGLSGVVGLGGGWDHSVALLADGTLRAWGNDEYGQLGDGNSGTGVMSSIPVTVTLLSGVVAIAVGHSGSLALKSDGSVWSWGVDWYGELGNGLPLSATLDPVRVLGVGGSGYLTKVTAISTFMTHCLALLSDGKVCAWGNDASGQLGDGNSGSGVTSTTPVMVTGISDVIAISAGNSHSLALRSDGTVWAWGNDENGQLGDGLGGTGVLSAVPTRVKGEYGSGYLTEIVAISAGAYHSLAVKSDGTVWAWGSNGSGQLGDGTGDSSSTPVKVTGLTDIVMAKAGGVHSLALKSDGTAWGWGSNTNLQVGSAVAASSQTVPIRVDWTYSE